MSNLMEQAKELIRRSVRAQPCDRIIFTGNGCTGAISHLIHALNLRNPTKPKTSVFLTIAEHHSNYLPWQHLPVKLEIIPLEADGLICQTSLRRALSTAKAQGSPIVCSFIAGSNVTGVLQRVQEVADLIHAYGGLSIWDYAGSAPYVPIQMHSNSKSGKCSSSKADSYLDAIVLSPHKFLGGPGAPGVLIANGRLFRNQVPFCPGGGTVRFVCPNFTHYSTDLERRETGGTPNIIGIIQAGLAFQLKDRHLAQIQIRNRRISQLVRAYLDSPRAQQLQITMLNPATEHQTPQIPVFAVTIRDLHYNLIVALLNDLYGVQSRGGISCCSLFAQHLLHLDNQQKTAIYRDIVGDRGVPADYGWCRLSFHYSLTDAQVQYCLRALDCVAEHGLQLAPWYSYVPSSNIWVGDHLPGYVPLKPLRLDYRKAPHTAVTSYRFADATATQLNRQYEQQRAKVLQLLATVIPPTRVNGSDRPYGSDTPARCGCPDQTGSRHRHRPRPEGRYQAPKIHFNYCQRTPATDDD